ncbi:Leucine-Rich Repeat-Containing Protein 59 [Manis pentadactyla]|nr:Leucine-Rich Repeat-Containing Protein 59 [Manis pentadactyla]
MKVAVARPGAAAVGARGAECGATGLEPGAGTAAPTGRDGSTPRASPHRKQSQGWTAKKQGNGFHGQ